MTQKTKTKILIVLLFVLMFVMAVQSRDKPAPATTGRVSLSEILDLK